MKKIEVAALKKVINQEIENENYEKADELVQKLCELQGLHMEGGMPEAFVFKLKQKEKERKRMSIRRNVIKAAACILFLSISGGTVYAAVQHFRNVEHMKYGLETGITEKEATDESTVSSMTTEKLPEKEDKVEVITEEKGDESTAWITKEVRQREYSGYISDDGINWREDEPHIIEETEYSYTDYSTACKDNDIAELFTTSYKQNGNTAVIQEVVQGVFNQVKLVSSFEYKNGKFKVEESKDLEWDNSKEMENLLITSTEPVTNQREYTSLQGYTFKLSDDNETGIVRTTTLISYNEYNVILSFTDLSDQEIYEILDTININNP